jgi:hypothetical protein
VRILLDAKDLINVVEFGRPVEIAAFDSRLKRNGAVVALSLTSVSDFVGPVFSAGGDWLNMRALLQKLETLPVVYIREGLIIRDELNLALSAYQAGREPSGLDPYVSRWDETGYWEGESEIKVLVGLRLDEIVYMGRRVIQSYKAGTPRLAAKLRWERSLPLSERLPLRDIFVNAIPDRLRAHRIAASAVDLRAFGQWLWSAPSRCPGLRLHFEAYHQIRKDEAMPLQDGDIADFAQIAAIPYADLSTVDKRISDVVRKAFRKLGKNDAKTDLSSRVFTKIDDVLAHLP